VDFSHWNGNGGHAVVKTLTEDLKASVDSYGMVGMANVGCAESVVIMIAFRFK